MIRINLLPYRPARRQQWVQQIIIAWAAAGVIAAALVFWFDLGLQSQIEELASQKSANETTIAELDKKLTQISDLDQKKKEIKERLAAVDRLRHQRLVSLHLLDDVSRAIPEKVWLISMVTKGTDLMLTGNARANSDVADFMRHLNQSAYIEDVTLTQVNQSVTDQKVKGFTLKARIELPQPPSEEKDGKGKDKSTKGKSS